jgi:hypothetical protein
MAGLDGPVNPHFHSPFIPKQHKDLMRKQVDLSHLNLNFWEQAYNLIHEYWLVFDERGVFIPVKYYKCIIDTGTALAYCSKEDLVQHMRDYYHATLYIGPGQGWSHPPDHGWQLVVQGITGPKTSSGEYTKH